MSTIKNCKFDKCDGLKNIVMAGSGKKPEIIPGMKLALCINKVLIDVETMSMSENKSRFVGKVLEIGKGIDNECTLSVGDSVSFTIENIAHLS
jgi:hypothetical protein